MGCWKACVRIMKKVEGAYYLNTQTGEYEGPTNIIDIAADHPTYFKMTIHVSNCKSTTLTNVEVTDTIKNTVAPVSWKTNKGEVDWSPWPIDYDDFHFDELTWTIGDLEPYDVVYLEIWLQTLPNPSQGLRYEPTSGDEGGGQSIEINGEMDGGEPDGATVTTESPLMLLTVTTDGLVVNVIGDGVEDGKGLISPELPQETLWAEDRYP